MKKYAAFAASVAISGAMLVGCGGDDDFCDAGEDIIGSSEAPSADQLQDLADEAPDEISDDIQLIVDAQADPASADPAALTEASDNITAWGEENCE